jgi:ribosome-associated translation inhibitor RaiA
MRKKGENMQIMFSSKTFELTDKVKSFVLEKVERLQKFPSLGINQLQVVIDRVKRGGKTTSEAQVEVVAQL